MKVFFRILPVLILSSVLVLQCTYDRSKTEVYIPDENLLESLIAQGVDRNRDGAISIKEAESFVSIKLMPSWIQNLHGLEAFINLDTLVVIVNPIKDIDLSYYKALKYLEVIGCELSELDISKNLDLNYLNCSGSTLMKNYLTSLDISNNILLEHLICRENQIENLDISANTELKILHCGYNRLTDLNLKNNLKLTTLSCNNNLLESVDVSRNIKLETFICCGNRLIGLDVSKNNSLRKLGIDNMPMLNKVCVWTLPFPPPGVEVLMDFSPGVEFTAACGNQ
jgi:hypothetical protein